MTVPILVAIFAVVAVILFVRASRAFFWDSYVRGVFDILLGVVFVLAALATAALGWGLATYERVTDEQHVAVVEVEKKDDHFNAMLTFPGAKFQAFEMRGDEWRVDARVLRWKGIVVLLGYDTVYRLDRIAGRYRNPEDEKSKPKTAYELNAPAKFDVFDLAAKAMERLPGLEAAERASNYVPLVAGATYEVKVSPDALVIRPTNDIAKKAK